MEMIFIVTLLNLCVCVCGVSNFLVNNGVLMFHLSVDPFILVTVSCLVNQSRTHFRSILIIHLYFETLILHLTGYITQLF